MRAEVFRGMMKDQARLELKYFNRLDFCSKFFWAARAMSSLQSTTYANIFLKIQRAPIQQTFAKVGRVAVLLQK